MLSRYSRLCKKNTKTSRGWRAGRSSYAKVAESSQRSCFRSPPGRERGRVRRIKVASSDRHRPTILFFGSSFLAQDGAARDTFLALGSCGGCFRKAPACGDSDSAPSLFPGSRSAVEVTSALRLGNCWNLSGEMPFTWNV